MLFFRSETRAISTTGKLHGQCQKYSVMLSFPWGKRLPRQLLQVLFRPVLEIGGCKLPPIASVTLLSTSLSMLSKVTKMSSVEETL